MRAATRDAMTVATRRWMWVATAAMIWVVEGVGLLIAVGAAIGAAIWAREGGAMSVAAMVVIWAAAVPAILAAWRCVAWAGLRASTRVVARMLGATEAAMWDAAMDETKPATWDATEAATMHATRPTTLDPMEAATRPAILAATWDATEAATVASKVLFIDGVPIPDDVHVSPAPQSASETQKRLLGAWVGTWSDSSRHILIVEDIRADGEARVVCADSSEWSREEGTVSGDTLTVFSTYKLIATDMLLATFDFCDFHLHARMSRIELAALTRPGATINWPDGVEFLDTDLTEDGKRVRLEVVLFKPKGSGPFPLLVFNHGRIYGGRPASLTWTETHPELAAFFLEKGWMVAFPQRRGRGKTDGLHKEGLDGHEALTRTETPPELAAFFLEWGWTVAFPRHESRWVYDPGISRPGADRALNDIETAIAALQRRPDVAGKRLLIGGASGGGILSITYAGLHPQQIAGVINFVGGWIGDRYRRASEINGGLFARGARYDRATLWLYGRRDSEFSIAHSRSNYETFVRAGGKGEFIEFDVPGGNGHNLSGYPDLWREDVEKYLEILEPGDRP